jgi:hypothetical protein
MHQTGIPSVAVPLVGLLLAGLLAGCQAQASRRPLHTSPVETGAGTTESIRRQFEGAWTLVSFTVFNAAGTPQELAASGRLIYDAYGNLDLAGKLATPQAGADVSALSFKGRAVIDPGGKRLVLADVSGNVDPATLPAQMGPDKVRFYSFEGDTLSLETRDGARVLARTVWRKAP